MHKILCLSRGIFEAYTLNSPRKTIIQQCSWVKCLQVRHRFAKKYVGRDHHRLSLSDLGLTLCRITIDIVVKGAEEVRKGMLRETLPPDSDNSTANPLLRQNVENVHDQKQTKKREHNLPL